MRVAITHLKAPWPAGAKPGDVVEFKVGSVPAWAIGKCCPAADGAEAAHVVDVPPPPIISERAKAEAKAVAEARAAAASAVDDGGDDEAAAALAAANAQAQAEKDEAERLVALKAEAETLGMRVDRRWGADRLAAEIAEHKAANPAA